MIQIKIKRNRVTSVVSIIRDDGAEVTLKVKGFNVKGLANPPALERGEDGEPSLYEMVNVALDKAYKDHEDAIVFNPQSVVDYLTIDGS